MASTFHDLLTSADPHAVALRFEQHDTSYGDLRSRVERLAGGLSSLGIEHGDVVGIWLPNTPDWIAAFFACARLGVIALSLNMRYGAHEVGSFVRRSKCKALFYVPDYRWKKAAPILEQVPAADLVTLRTLIAVGPETSPPQLGQDVALHSLATLESHPPFTGEGGQPGDRVIIMSSSGTTSQPKLIVHSQERLVHHGSMVAQHFGVTRETARVGLIVPTCGAYGFTVMLMAMHAHAVMSVVEAFEPESVARLLVEERITHVYGTNDQVEKILAVVPASWRAPDLVLFGHANFTPGLTQVPQQALDRGIRMNGLFGMTETMALFAAQPFDAPLPRRTDAGGLPLCPSAKARVRSLETGELLPPGETGQLELSTPDMMLEYLYDAEATRQAFTDDGWLRTGDLGYMMTDGGFTHLSRIGDVLRIGGYLVNPLEIEEAVLADPTVHACQVVEVTASGSVRPVAFVIGHPGYRHDEASLIAACKGKLAIYKVPIRVFEVTEFPITASPNGNKVRKTELREQAKQRIANEART